MKLVSSSTISKPNDNIDYIFYLIKWINRTDIDLNRKLKGLPLFHLINDGNKFSKASRSSKKYSIT